MPDLDKASSSAVTPDEPPLDDLMIAMDVVDTLRREQHAIDRELNSDEQEQRLIERLRQMYTSQGIEVSDQILTEGVEALRQDRFRYESAAAGFERKLAEFYIDRWHWLGRLGTLVAVCAVIGAGYWLFVAGPRARVRRDLPIEIARLEESITTETQETPTQAQAKRLADEGRQALSKDDSQLAKRKLGELRQLKGELDVEYELRIVAKGATGVWRVPRENPTARNYYIVVEAVTPDDKILKLPIVSEETGATQFVSKWGLRVEEVVARQVEADKKDDGIIQDRTFGVKRRGTTKPEYLIPTTGDAITEW